MAQWNRVPLIDYIELIGGGTPKTTVPEYWNGNIPWLSVKDFNNDKRYVYSTEKHISQSGFENSPTKMLHKDDIIISARGTVGEIAMIPFDMAFNQSCYGIRASRGIDQPFLYYLLKNCISQLKRMTHGSVFDTITRDTFANIEVDIPDAETQKRISSVLADIDNKIEVNDAINDNLEQQAKLLYNYWFIQFNFPDENGNPYHSSGGQLVWNKNLQQEIPQDWRSGNLYDIADYINGIACQKYRPSDEEHSLPVVKIREMNGGITNDTERVSSTIPAKNIISSGDILFSWSASLEVIMWYGVDAGLNQHIFKVVPKSYFSSEYVYLQLSEYLIHFIKIAEARKTTMGHITSEHLQDSHIILPPANIIKNFSEYVRPIYQMKKQIANETSELIKLRDWLIPMLMNGQATISD